MFPRPVAVSLPVDWPSLGGRRSEGRNAPLQDAARQDVPARDPAGLGRGHRHRRPLRARPERMHARRELVRVRRLDEREEGRRRRVYGLGGRGGEERGDEGAPVGAEGRDEGCVRRGGRRRVARGRGVASAPERLAGLPGAKRDGSLVSWCSALTGKWSEVRRASSRTRRLSLTSPPAASPLVTLRTQSMRQTPSATLRAPTTRPSPPCCSSRASGTTASAVCSRARTTRRATASWIGSSGLPYRRSATASNAGSAPGVPSWCADQRRASQDDWTAARRTDTSCSRARRYGQRLDVDESTEECERKVSRRAPGNRRCRRW